MSRQTHRQERGSVLLIVLWIAFGLVSVALLFGHSMMFEYRAAENATAGMKAAHAVESAREYVLFVLENLEETGTLPDIEEYESENVAVGEAVFWLLGRGDDSQFRGEPVYGLIDEASKLNLNTATQEMLEALPGMTSELAAATIDWRDSDIETSPEGAESEAYLLRDPSYYAKDSSFETIDEMHLLLGAEWKILHGEDPNRNGYLDPNEDDGAESVPEDDRDGNLDPGVLEYVTVFSREPNTGSDGSARININGENDQELTQLLQETFGESRANQILQAASGGQEEYGSVLEFQIRTQMTADEFSQIEDQLTVSDDEYLQGLVNVNTASAAVLACLPGIGEEYAERLVAYRSGNTENLTSTAWVTEVLDEESAIAAGPYITTRTYQIAADVAAVAQDGRGYRRSLFVIDTSGDEPLVIFRRDLDELGWALGTDVRAQLALAMEERS